MTTWYGKETSGGQGLIIDEKTGRSVAVAYDAKDTALLAAAPRMLAAIKAVLELQADPSIFRLPNNCEELQELRSIVYELEDE